MTAVESVPVTTLSAPEEVVAQMDIQSEERRSRTSTQSFGTSRREGHDASDFYSRFTPPQISTDETVNPCSVNDTLIQGDSRDMSAVNDNSVALVVTSPPYYVGKEYELEVGKDGVPAGYVEYLEMLRDTFRECYRVLEPGGRIAVNVANLGRKPYRSLSGDVVRILQDDLGMLLRGEIIWVKAAGASGSCAWGSWASAANPTLRDLTERVVIASKGRFDRAIKRDKRAKLGLPHVNSISGENFMQSTLDVWEIRPESARRIGHPAPFPVELPRRLIELYTYEEDTVLDPYVGAGSTPVAALRTNRHYVGYDLSAEYLKRAQERIDDEKS